MLSTVAGASLSGVTSDSAAAMTYCSSDTDVTRPPILTSRRSGTEGPADRGDNGSGIVQAANSMLKTNRYARYTGYKSPRPAQEPSAAARPEVAERPAPGVGLVVLVMQISIAVYRRKQLKPSDLFGSTENLELETQNIGGRPRRRLQLRCAPTFLVL